LRMSMRPRGGGPGGLELHEEVDTRAGKEESGTSHSREKKLPASTKPSMLKDRKHQSDKAPSMTARDNARNLYMRYQQLLRDR